MMMGFGFLGMLFLWGLLLALATAGVAAAVWLARPARVSDRQGQPTARQIVDERFARGELSREEYERIRAQIG